MSWLKKPADTSGKPCTEFLNKGTCKYGDSCSFSHANGPNGRGGPDPNWGIKDEAELVDCIRRIKGASKKQMGFKKVYKEVLKRWPDVRQSQVKGILKEYDMEYKAPVLLPKGFVVGSYVQSLVAFAPIAVGDCGTVSGACSYEESPEDYTERLKVDFGGGKGHMNLLANSQVVLVQSKQGAQGSYAGVASPQTLTSFP